MNDGIVSQEELHSFIANSNSVAEVDDQGFWMVSFGYHFDLDDHASLDFFSEFGSFLAEFVV